MFLEWPRAAHQAKWKPSHQEANICCTCWHWYHRRHLFHGGAQSLHYNCSPLCYICNCPLWCMKQFFLLPILQSTSLIFVSGLWWLHSPTQQHRHSLRALVVREAHQHDLLPQDQGAVSLETQRARDTAQQVLYQKGQEVHLTLILILILCFFFHFWITLIRYKNKCPLCVLVSRTLLLC